MERDLGHSNIYIFFFWLQRLPLPLTYTQEHREGLARDQGGRGGEGVVECWCLRSHKKAQGLGSPRLGDGGSGRGRDLSKASW